MTPCRLCGGRSIGVASYDLALIQPEWREWAGETEVEVRRCLRFGSYYTGNVPEPSVLQRQYKYDADAYFSQPGMSSSEKWKKKLQVLKDHVSPSCAVLDLGGGDGAFARAAAAAGFRSWLQELNVVDKAALERDGVHWRNPENLASGEFDAVTLWDVYEHVWPHDDLLAAAKRALRPQGLLLVEIPSPSHLVPAFVVAALAARGPTRARLLAQICNFTHVQLMTPAELRATLPRFGLELLDLQQLSELSYAGEVYASRFTKPPLSTWIGQVFDAPALRRVLLGYNKTLFVARFS